MNPIPIRYPVSQKVLDAICGASEGRLYNYMGELFVAPDTEEVPEFVLIDDEEPA